MRWRWAAPKAQSASRARGRGIQRAGELPYLLQLLDGQQAGDGEVDQREVKHPDGQETHEEDGYARNVLVDLHLFEGGLIDVRVDVVCVVHPSRNHTRHMRFYQLEHLC